MRVFNQPYPAWKAVWQLGIGQVSLNALYRLGLRAGLWRRLTPPGETAGAWSGALPPPGFARLPNLAALRTAYRQFMDAYPQAAARLIAEANEIRAGKVRLFGAGPAPLELDPGLPLEHWTDFESGKIKAGPDGDIKFIWEPARFGWAMILARAYLLSGDDGYAQCFWQNFLRFHQANPANLGPNWTSGQEVALRLIALLFALHIFADAPASTPERQQLLLDAAVQHARRIPPTLLYARSQHNNHLVTEALGLYTAGLLLSGHPGAAGWKRTGWRWLQRALRAQIAADGTYAQHSTNYHRLMLQAALWGHFLARQTGQAYSAPLLDRLSAAAVWLADHLDRSSGQASNLGANDGALIFPLACADFHDYRPTAQAACCAFHGAPLFPPGPWDELSFWLDLPLRAEPEPAAGRSLERRKIPRPSDCRLDSLNSWASLRAAHYTSRPSQADQLHVDVWMHGWNVALDPGTYRYTARPPWDNTLSSTLVHNTICIDGGDQMLRAGRFLWLDWAQANWTRMKPDSLKAAYDGIIQQGVVHSRRLSLAGPDTWLIEDQIESAFRQDVSHRVTLNWLLPDWRWYIDGCRLLLTAPFGEVALECHLTEPTGTRARILLIREGKSLLDSRPTDPLLGWYSPTYSVKIPALSYQLCYTGHLPVSFTSRFSFSAETAAGAQIE